MHFLRLIITALSLGLFGHLLSAESPEADNHHNSALDTEVGQGFAELRESIEEHEASHDSQTGQEEAGHPSHQHPQDAAHREEDHGAEHPADSAHYNVDMPLSSEPADVDRIANPGLQVDPRSIHYEEGDRTPYTSSIERASGLQEKGEYAAAINVYLDVLNIADVPEYEHKQAMVGLAETYYRRGSYTQALSMLDQFIQTFPEDERRPEILFQIGLLYREMRLFPKAITSFYRVLNSIVVTGETDIPKYLSLARRAQFEIARSHFFAEEWDQALVLLDRIELFELSETDRESLLYYQAQATLRMGNHQKGLELVQKLIHDYPTSPLVPEMLYTKAETLAQMQQQEDAVETLMELLEHGGLPDENDGEEWRYWRQQAGNYFANRYYENKDYLAALRLYQGILVLDERPEWQLPIIFQMGICFEKLGMFDRASESLQFVIQSMAEQSEDEKVSADAALKHLLERAQWRLSMLEWRSGIERNSLPLLTQKTNDSSEDEE